MNIEDALNYYYLSKRQEWDILFRDIAENNLFEYKKLDLSLLNKFSKKEDCLEFYLKMSNPEECKKEENRKFIRDLLNQYARLGCGEIVEWIYFVGDEYLNPNIEKMIQKNYYGLNNGSFGVYDKRINPKYNQAYQLYLKLGEDDA